MTFLNLTALAKPSLFGLRPGLCDRLTRLVLSLLAAAPWPVQAMTAIEQWQQPNGAQIYLVRSLSIPMLDVRIDVDAGARREPQEQVGLVSGMAGMFNKGVLARGEAPALDENAVSQAWADLGASFGASASADRLSFSLRTLTEPELLNQAVALAARQLGEPAFPAAVWERERQRYVANLRESYTRPASVAGRAFNTGVYGRHPYGRDMTEQTLARVNVEQMRLFYEAYVSPCRTRVSLVGAIDRAQADALVSQLLARMPQVPCSRLVPLTAVAEVPPLAQASEQRIPFKSTQATLLMGQPGFKRDDPDFFALTVGNYILGGGGFVSRLTTEVREKRGLTYGVSSYFSPGLHAGAFTVGLQTRADQVDQALGVVRQVLRDFVSEGPSQAELRAAKDNLMGGFPLRLDSNAKLLENVANIAWFGLPLDYLQTWTGQIDRVTVADIKAAFQRKLQPGRMLTVVVGGP